MLWMIGPIQIAENGIAFSPAMTRISGLDVVVVKLKRSPVTGKFTIMNDKTMRLP